MTEELIKVYDDGKAVNDLLWFSYSEKGMPMGVVALNVRTEEIQCLLVDSPHRRKKIATKLIQMVEKKAIEYGLTRIFATTALDNEASKGLFESMGYVKWLKYNKVLKRRQQSET